MKTPKMNSTGSRLTTPSSKGARRRTASNNDGLYIDTSFEENEDVDPASRRIDLEVTINNGFSSRYSPTKEGTSFMSGPRGQKKQTIAPALTDHQIQQKITHIVVQRPSNKKGVHIFDVNPTPEPLNDIAEIKKVISNLEYINQPRNQIHSNDHARVYCPLHSNTSAALYIEFNALPVYKEPPTFMTSDKYLASSPTARKNSLQPESDAS